MVYTCTPWPHQSAFHTLHCSSWVLKAVRIGIHVTSQALPYGTHNTACTLLMPQMVGQQDSLMQCLCPHASTVTTVVTLLQP